MNVGINQLSIFAILPVFFYFLPWVQGNVAKNNYNITIGVSKNLFDKIKDSTVKSFIENLQINVVIINNDLKSQDAIDEFFNTLTSNKSKYGFIIKDEICFNSQGDFIESDFKEAIRGYMFNLYSELNWLTNPNFEGMNENVIEKIEVLSQQRNMVNCLISLLPLESYDLQNKALGSLIQKQKIYGARINNLHKQIFNNIDQNFVKEKIKTTKKIEKCISVSATSTVDLRFLANVINDLGVTKEQASQFIHVRIRNEKITANNLDYYLEVTGLGRYLSRNNIKIVNSLDTSLTKTINIIKETFQDIKEENIIIGDSKFLINIKQDSEVLKKDKSPVFVHMNDFGVSSQLFWVLLEIGFGNKNILLQKSLGQLINNERYKNCYIYIPELKIIDYNNLLKEIEQYEKVCSMA